ncbi:hypothetical protein Bca52824_051407 [Brassica carinata]|uniref:Ubiquitin-like protease family profile domain-containing protein n=1 Tax=Brassica carinata TaxID=52824 RepID=A0A8X7UIN1_BRACI|nr:hypothetical protein Bca52824_051407 [Brassica carinata]
MGFNGEKPCSSSEFHLPIQQNPSVLPLRRTGQIELRRVLPFSSQFFTQDMSLELPKRIFKEGEEPQVTQINNNCRIEYIMRKFTEWMPKELEVIFKLHKNGLGFSARVVHSFLCRELVTYKLHELWFVVARNRQYVEKFAAMISRIVKAVAPPERQKQLLLASYSIVDVPMKKRLNKSCCDCGAYALKHLECHLLGIDLNLLDDEIIMGCRQKIGVDLWEVAHDYIYAEAMTRYVPSPWEREEVFDLED